MEHGRDGQSFNIIIFAIAVYRKVNNGKKGKCVHILFLTNLFYRLVPEAEVDAKRAKALQNIIIILYNRD